MSLDFIHKDCHHSMSKDKKLPKDSFLVVYKVKDEIKHDITRAGSKVEIFDHYYDKYKTGLKGWKQTAGQVNPKQWNPEPEKKSASKPSQRKRK